MRQRRDVQGLRAVAVLLVVLYHFDFGFKGGYLGVDMFFVISGYVISRSTLGEIQREGQSGSFQAHPQHASGSGVDPDPLPDPRLHRYPVFQAPAFADRIAQAGHHGESNRPPVVLVL